MRTAVADGPRVAPCRATADRRPGCVVHRELKVPWFTRRERRRIEPDKSMAGRRWRAPGPAPGGQS